MKKMLLTLPEELVDAARAASGIKTKSEAVTIALVEYLKDKKLSRLLDRFGRGFGLSEKKQLSLRRAR